MNVVHKGSQSRITIPTEPAFLALGPNHLAVGMNNKVNLLLVVLHGKAQKVMLCARCTKQSCCHAPLYCSNLTCAVDLVTFHR